MEILMISSFAVVAPTAAESRKLYVDALGLPLKRHADDDYFFQRGNRFCKGDVDNRLVTDLYFLCFHSYE